MIQAIGEPGWRVGKSRGTAHGGPLLSSKPAGTRERCLPAAGFFLETVETEEQTAMPQFLVRTMLATGLMLAAPPLSATALLAADQQQAAPQGEDPPGADDDATVTPPPTEHNGVITPPPTGDEGIHTEAPDPNAGHDEEVIPPPGTEGGEPDAVPR
jgi:hypothetical protein